MRRTLCIQVQPTRVPALDMDRVRVLAEAIAQDEALVARFEVNEGVDQIPYINIMFETGEPLVLWRRIRSSMYDDHAIGDMLRNASMAMCEGDHGWDDYLLLHHFDPEIALDASDVR